jgi:hypothetical protein
VRLALGPRVGSATVPDARPSSVISGPGIIGRKRIAVRRIQTHFYSA